MKKMSSKLLSVMLAVLMVLSTLCGVTLGVGAEEGDVYALSMSGKITTIDFNTKSVESVTAGEVIGVECNGGEGISLLTVAADGTIYSANGKVLTNKNGNAYSIINKEANIVVVYDDVNGYARYYYNESIAYVDGAEAIVAVSASGAEGGVRINGDVVAAGYSCTAEDVDAIFSYVGYQEHEDDDKMRILSGINTIWYDKVGYEVELYDAAFDLKSVETVEGDKVYDYVLAAGDKVFASEYSYNFFAPLVVNEISEASVGSTIVVTPFAKAGEITYEGKAVKFTVTADGYEVDKNYQKPITEPTVIVGEVSGNVGDEVTVLVDVVNAPELITMGLSITYDESALEWVSVESGEAMSAHTFTAPSRLRSGANFMWYANDPASVNGTVLELVFKIKEDTAYGDYTITMICDPENTNDANYEPVALDTVNGKITVEEPKPTVTVGTASGSAGKEVTVLVDVANAPDLITMGLSITYDESVLEWVSVESGEAMSAHTFTAPSRLRSGANFMWYANDPASVNGTILVLVFKIKSGVELGDYEITMTCDLENTNDANYESLELATVAGKVTVEKPKQFVSVGNVNGVAGSDVTVYVEVADAPDLLEMVLAVEYDDSALTLISAESCGAVSEFEYDAPRRLKNGAEFGWWAEEASSVNGTVLALTFTIAEDADAEEYEITMTCDPAGTFDANENEIELDSISGVITLITDPTVVVGKVVGAAGDTVTVDVNVANVSDILELVLEIDYDNSVMTLSAAESGVAMSAFEYEAPRRLKNGAEFYWYADEAAPVNGTVLTLTFTIDADAEAGEYEVSLICVPEGTFDADEAEIDIPNISGSVKVTG